MKNNPVIERFSKLLKESTRTTEEGRILSYRFPVRIDDFESLVNSQMNSCKNAFYFQKTGENTRFIATGKVSSVRSEGDERFELLGRTVEGARPLIVRHFNGASDTALPLFVGSMSFFPEHRDPMWRDFHPSDWFIPELIVAGTKDGYTASYQIDLQAAQDREQSVNRFAELLASLNTYRDTAGNRPGETRRLHDDNEKTEWMKKVSTVVDAIRRGQVSKVVLSRHITISGVDEKRIIKKLTNAGKSFADSYIFLYKSGNSLFMGISPEKLASFSGGIVHCNAIAGSIARGQTEEEEHRLGNELLNSPKNLDEHKIVVSHIKSVLNRYCSSVDIDHLPRLKKLSYIQHLYTGAGGTLHPGIPIVQVLQDLHPTPAVGGYPLMPALKMIENLEQYDRGLYTGFVGWFDAEGNGDFCVALRSALLVDDTLHAFAGGGIVVDSNPEDEYLETEIKLQAITSLLHP